MKFGTVTACALFALGAVGCASSTKLENQSRIHEARAHDAARAQNYEVAAREQEKARELHDKAVKRAYKEGNAGEVTVPAEVPYPPPPPQH